jgi:hypothetical protein
VLFLGTTIGYGSNNLLLLGIRAFVDAKLWPWCASREDAFVNMLFHELLHIWLCDNIDDTKSQLLKKYSQERDHVRSHIHLMAIQKMVYLRLNRLDMLGMIDKFYTQVATTDYKQAWKIINDLEGYENVIHDCLNSLKS